MFNTFCNSTLQTYLIKFNLFYGFSVKISSEALTKSKVEF